MKPFRFAVQCVGAPSGAVWRERARRIEGLGYATAYVPDHLGEQWAPTVAMTITAEATTTLRVGCLVFDVDYRHPAILAKEMATLDLASAGRVEFGIGAGWMRSDYEQAGIPFDAPRVRIERMVEAIEICRGLWTGKPYRFDGRHYRLADAIGSPLPCRRGGPPVVVGGGGKRVLTAAARYADIVGINVALGEGTVGVDTARSAVGERFAERRRWVEEAAGPGRFPALELQLNTFLVQVTDRAGELYESMAGGFGLSPEEARTVPMVLAGSVADICEQLHHHREAYGVSYIVVPEAELDAFAPVVARLAGT